MPQLDGVGMTRALRRIRPDIRILLITGEGEGKPIAAARGAGVSQVMHKPFTAEQLLTHMQQLLDLKKPPSPANPKA